MVLPIPISSARIPLCPCSNSFIIQFNPVFIKNYLSFEKALENLLPILTVIFSILPLALQSYFVFFLFSGLNSTQLGLRFFLQVILFSLVFFPNIIELIFISPQFVKLIMFNLFLILFFIQ
jgi:hypothetical protein